MTLTTRIIYAILLVLPGTALTQNIPGQQDNPRFEHITVEDGLPHGNVHCILQDRQGFMWFGSHGLCKYDGVRIEVFKPRIDDPGAMLFDVRVIYEARDGVLWIGTAEAGLARFDPITEQFTVFQYDQDDPTTLSDKSVTAILEDHEGMLWIGTNWHGLNRIDPKTQEITRFSFFDNRRDPRGLYGRSVRGICEDTSRGLWVLTNRGVNQLDRSTDQFKHYGSDQDALDVSIPRGITSALWNDSDGHLWIGTEKRGVYRLDPGTEAFSRFLLEEDPSTSDGQRVSAICKDRTGRFWLGTRDGVLQLSEDHWILRRYQHDASDTRSLSNNLIRCLVQDRSGLIWVGTAGGVSRFDPSPQALTELTLSMDDAQKTSIKNVSAIAEDHQGGLWFGTWNAGLWLLDPNTGQWQLFQHDPADPNSLADNRVSAIQVSGQDPNIVWIGHSRNALSRLDLRSGEIIQARHLFSEQNRLSDGRVRCLFEDREHTLWIGTWFGLNWLDQETLEFGRYQPDASDPELKIPVHILAIAEDASGAIWAGTVRGGLYRLDDRKAGHFTRYLADPNDPQSLGHDHIRSLFKDSRGRLWVGTRDGVSRYEAETDSFTRFIHSHFPFGDHGWSHLNDIQTILEDDNGHLWLGSQDGVHVLSGLSDSNIQARRFETLSGYSLGAMRPHARLKGSNGTLYFGTTNGLFAIHPKRMRATDPPEVVLTDLKLFSESVPIASEGTPLARHLSVCDEITLGHEQRVITIDFAALDYTNPSQNQYAYKLEGLMEDWVSLGRQANATLTNLDPGEYVFRVKAANSYGVWNEAGTSLRLTITPFWWEAPWFRILMAVLILGGTAGGLKGHFQLTKARQRALENTVEERTAQLRTSSEELAEARDNLELQVQQRTAELEQEVVERKQTYDALQESESLLMGFIQGADDAICIRDRDRRILLWNEAFAQGIKAHCGVEVCAGMRAEDYIPAETLAEFTEQRERMLEAYTGKATRVVYRYPCQAGEVRILDVRWFPVWDSGKVMAVSEITRDISDQETAKQQLQEAERRYRTVAWSSTDIIREIDPERGRFDWIGDQDEPRYGRQMPLPRSVDEWIAMIHPDDREHVRNTSETAFATGHYFFLEYRIRTSSGEYRYWEDRASVISGSTENNRLWIGACTDVTERQLTEQARQESELKYRSVVENAREMIFVSQEGLVQYHNPQALEWTGYSHEELTSTPFIEFIYPEDREKVLQEYQDRISGKKSSARYVIRMLTKQGDARWIIVNSALITWEGSPASLIMITDITARKAIEDELMESQANLQRAQSVGQIGSWQLDLREDTLVWSNETYKIFGMSSELPLTYEAFLAYVHPEDRDTVNQHWQGALKGNAYDLEHRILLGGQVKWVRERAELEFDAQGKAIAGIGTVQDITDLKQAQIILQESREQARSLARRLLSVQEEERRRLARELHDDLSQRLAVLAIEAGKLEEESRRNEDPMFVKLKQVRERIVQVSADVHSLSRQIHPSIIDDLGLVDAMRSEITALSSREKIAVEFREQDVPRTLPRDITLTVYRILQEGLRNCVKHAEASLIQVSFSVEADALHLLIRDNGVGFDSSATLGSLGIGLASMRERAGLVNGQVDVESTMGEGTVVRLAVPLKGSA